MRLDFTQIKYSTTKQVSDQNEGDNKHDQVANAIAVIGLSCRLPMANSPQAFWGLLRNGTNAITEMPADRWNLASSFDPGMPRSGGFLDQIDHFDADFFGISPREATMIDPQQRLMLELSWEALEDAGIIPGELHGSKTGVFVGAIWDDYATLLHHHGIEAITSYTVTGLHRSIIANRVSYTLGLRGPSMTIDTAQSSSLVAVHMASESLRRGEATLALAGGVNLNIAPESTTVMARFGALSPDSRCFTFDERANGYVRSEGGAVVVLKKLAQAIADGNTIYSVILGSAVNNDGATDGLTVPNRLAQQEVIQLAYERSRIQSAGLQYVELHGSGTRLGDPIEAEALGAALGTARTTESPLLVGSVKTNVGHLEGAAGIVGLLKVVLSIKHRELPPSLNFETPNPQIAWEALRLRVQSTLGPWPHPDRQLVAGVSAFGMGGTNCHVVLSDWIQPDERQSRLDNDNSTVHAVVSATQTWVLSGKSAMALRAQAQALRVYVEAHPELLLTDIGYSLATTRSSFTHRAALIAQDRDDFLKALSVLAEGGEAPNLVRSQAGIDGKVVFVFPGQGQQWPGMTLELLDSSPVFAQRMRECSEALASFTEWSLLDVLRGTSGAPPLDRTDVVQPVLFAVMVSLAALWQSSGIKPDAVVGHSQGEIAAACVAGALSLHDAARVVALRSKATAALVRCGGMISVRQSLQQVESRLQRWKSRLSIAVVNGPESIVVAGDLDAIDELLAEYEAEGVRVRKVAVDYAAHSEHVDALSKQLQGMLVELTPRSATIPFYSTVMGQRMDSTKLDAEYWGRNLRQTVHFEQAAQALLMDGHQLFIEVSAHPVLNMDLQETFEAAGATAVAVGSLRRNAGGLDQFLRSLAEVYVRGVALDWEAIFAGVYPQRIPLPTYVFQRQRYWLDTTTRLVEVGIPVSEADSSGFAQRLARMSRAEQDRTLLDLLQTLAVVVLGRHIPHMVDTQRPFKHLGFDSLTSVELCNRLSAVTGLRLSPALLYDYPTPAALIRHLRTEALGIQDEVSLVTAPFGATNEPIAIIGMSCRYPGGAASPEDLWQLVADASNVVGVFPTNRGWDIQGLYDSDPDAIGKSYTRSGGFLYDAADFDAAFFGISPLEALAMDPQQRLLLETAWETFERGGIDPNSLRGSRTGVFVGAMSPDYGPRLHENPEDPQSLGGYLLTGTTASVISGRLAYSFGLEGPTVTVDTACSSSLVALHLAAQALRQGECELALSGGVTVLSTPNIFIDSSRQRAISQDGLCKAFAAAAAGTGWGEGVGLVLLERLSDARRNGHQVLALLRGSAINQDGASNGLTAPSGLSQQRVIRQALANARLTPGDVDAVEAHGTGTKLGDPIEAQAIFATYGQKRPDDQPLWLGSLKSNIGHTQAAAGVAGVIKMVMAMRHGILPKTLHIDQPTPHVDWTAGSVSLLTEAMPWRETDHPRRAAVSSFGMSGTNAHVILEQAPKSESTQDQAPLSRAVGVWYPWVLSAKNQDALHAQARQLHSFVTARPYFSPCDIGYSLATTRSTFEHRAVVVAGGREDFLDGLAALADGEMSIHVVQGHSNNPGKTAFLFTGGGSQRLGMGYELSQSYPVFAEALNEVCTHLDAHLQRPIREVLWASEDQGSASLLDQTAFIPPALFALEVALFRLLTHLGLVPDFLIGHSTGELVAAHVAGILSLSDAARLVAARSRLMQALPAGGAMVSLQASADEVQAWLAGHEHQVSIAAINGPSSTVIAGDEEAVLSIAAQCKERGHKTKQLKVSHASHSPRMDAMLAPFRQVAESVSFAPPSIPIVSNVTGTLVTAEQICSAEYWVQHVRQTVRFLDGIRWLENAGVRTYVELGPDGVLTALAQNCLSNEEEAVIVPVLQSGQSETHTLQVALAHAHIQGATLNWQTIFPSAQRVDLPTYPFQRQRYWLDLRSERGNATSSDLTLTDQLITTSSDAQTKSQPSWRERIASLPEAECNHAVTELIRTTVASVLGYAPSTSIDPNRKFTTLGFNSLSAVQLRNRLNTITGLKLPVTVVFDYPTPVALANYLRTQIVSDQATSSQSVFMDLDKLEAALLKSTLPEQECIKVAARLQALLQTWNITHNTAKLNFATNETLQEATDSELFETLDKVLKSSGPSR